MQVLWNRRIRIGFGHVENLVLNQIRLVILVISWKRKKNIYIVFFQRGLMLHSNFRLEPSLIVIFTKAPRAGSTRMQFKKAQIFFVASQNIYIFARSVRTGLRRRLIYKRKKSILVVKDAASVRFLGESLFHKWKIQSLLLLGLLAYYLML
jgi:hypothetical protein